MIGTINGKPVEFSENETILQVAKRNGHFIPTLCEMADLDHTPGTCRVCLVEIQRRNGSGPQVVTSCNTPMEEGMAVLTRTPALREQQRLQVELLLADHNQDCAVCIRHGNCELQDVAQFVGLQQSRYHYPHFYEQRTRDDSSAAIVRDMSKCIRCLRCVKVCREIQGTDALVITEKGLATEISIRDSLPLGSSDCVACGQCILVCPVGALAERDDTETVIDYLYDPRIVTVFQFAPAIRVALGEAFRMPPGENVEGQIVTALKHLGADVVLDTNFTADLVIMEEGTELLHRIEKGGTLPMFTSCCPGWINFAEKNFPEILPHISTTRSPQQCFGSMAKTYLAEGMGIDPKTMRVISIMPCTAKKEEAKRPEFLSKGTPDVDVVLTTREFARLLEREGVDLSVLESSAYDNPWMGDYTGAAAIFGTTGGVMEAALRTVHKVVTGDELEGIEFQPVRGNEKVREAEVDLKNGTPPVKVAVAHSLKAARQMAEMVLAGEAPYHFIEIMACPGGCMGGGGQPRSKKAYQASWQERQNALYAIDRQRAVRQSHNNPLIEKIYDDFLEKPNSHKAHDLLHTTYRKRKRTIKHTMKEIWQEIEAR
ncbi:[FeFe] hydrogenase, group A [uncultured Desulfosarcina sp.]|uniref:[FeFe] hydrogenase, group A n=1 Tax=uncultured Desulfosarcina sp. TaxID=218289 RepID=UPI0029C71D9C|nr:[FeFe] hydrogenase, group A [uncultured Desulfosarcina sp.]